MTYPKLTSPWTRIIEYPENHLNDFCIFPGPDKQWHAVGIMGTGSWASETSLFHCTSPSLHGPYINHPPLLENTSQGGTQNVAPQKHAPFVVVRHGKCYMFYRRPPGTNLLVSSKDGFTWDTEPVVIFEERDARDACIQEFNGTYHWYYCEYLEVDGIGRSCIMLRCSPDLIRWSDPLIVHIDTSRKVTHSHLESPFVVHAEGYYWLFVRNRAMDAQCVTTIFKSDTPLTFGSGIKAWDFEMKNIHAPELIFENGQWYLARVSGPPDHLSSSPKTEGWIDIASISFRNC